MAGLGFKDFAVGEVLTSADVDGYLMQQSVMVFADSGARGSALGTATGTAVPLAEGMVSYLSDANVVEVYNGTSWVRVAPMKKVAAFTSSGTWTVPANVTYAIAHIRGGGGGIGQTTSGGDGGASSVAFSSGTVTANGGAKGYLTSVHNGPTSAGATNSGKGASSIRSTTDVDVNYWSAAQDGAEVVAGADVTPAASITVTVGAGGTAGTSGAAGGSGYVWIEYYE